ncbi:hypothetical protein [uncultured Helicobacter sp.]|uniref:hypothetical protein n=1 Tax=uncultured Helicobacter sp. TaxID=175537 RepID=UPI0037509389
MISEIATKDFVRAEILEAKQELRQEMAAMKQELKQDMANLKVNMIKWTLGIVASASILVIGANFALIGFLVQNLKG